MGRFNPDLRKISTSNMGYGSAITVNKLLAEAITDFMIKQVKILKTENKKDFVWQDVAQKTSFPSGQNQRRI